MTTKNVWIALALIAAAACGGAGGGGSSSTSPPPPPPPPPPPSGNAGPTTISVTNNAFSPATTTVPVGTTVQWTWNTCSGGDGYSSETCVAHSVTFDDGPTSSTQEKGTYSRTFNVSKTYTYHCLTHGTAMAGSITVP